MVATQWGTSAISAIDISSDAGRQFAPSVADSAGGSFGAAWSSATGITVRFFDVLGQPDPALGSFTLSSAAAGTSYGRTAMSAGGSGIGYGVAWEQFDATGVSSVHLRYVGLATPDPLDITVSSGSPTLAVHDMAMAGFNQSDAAGKPLSTVDGFNVAWIETDTGPGSSLTAQQIADGYGAVRLQRYSVPLDGKKDPAGSPLAVGLDGVVGGATDAPSVVATVGRDVAVASDPHLGGVTLVTWIDTANAVHAAFYTSTGASLTTASGAISGGVDLANLGTVANGQNVKVVSDGTQFIVAWATATGIAGRIIAAGTAPNTFTAGGVQQLLNFASLPAGETFNGDFSIAGLLDTGGFTLTLGATDGAGTRDLFTQTYNGGGGTDGVVTRLAVPGDQSQVAVAALTGDRFVAVYQTETGSDAGNIAAHIFDTRVAGQVLIGTDTPAKPRADVLVGTVGDDTLNGLGDDDELYGALGNDTLTGGTGDDIIDGGAGLDVVTFSGNRANYIVSHLGGDQFTVQDTRAGLNDGVDTVRGVENLQFADITVSTLSIIAGIVPVTPTAWGWTNSDGDASPDANGTPDADGFIVNHAPAARAGIQTNAFVADSVGEFIGIVWEQAAAPGGDTHIRGQFLDVIGAPDSFIPNTIDISDGVGIESNAVIVSGGANSGWGVAFEQRDNALDTTREIRTNFVGPGQLTSIELSVLNEGNLVDQHDAAMSGSFLDRTLASPVGGSVLPTGMNEGYNIAWVSTDVGSLLPSGYGRVMLQRFEVPLDALGNPGAPVAGGLDGIAGLDGHTVSSANDGATQLAAAGRNPSTAALHGFETAVIWIEQDGAGGERVAGKAYDDLGQEITIPGFADISAGFSVAAGTTAHIVSAGAVNFGVVWVTQSAPGVLTVMSTMYSPVGAGLDGLGFGFSAPAPFTLFDLPAGASASDLELSVTGISGEDSEDLVVSWKVSNSGNADVMAQHVAVALDPVTGMAIAMGAEGSAVTVNAETAGGQDGATVAGLLGDRFIAVYHDDNTNYTDGNDIVARILDTRDAVNPVPITGDLVRAGLPQARRDVLVGTNGDDSIRGDISDSDGRTDYIFSGMGDDTIQGGPGVRGAAGIPEIIDGGEGNDTAVYTGRLQDYSITINGDGSYEVIDLRPVQNAAGQLLVNDGIDNLYSIENIQFLDLGNGGASAQTISFGFPGTPPAPPALYDGTPVAWSLTDTSAGKEITVDNSAGTQSGVAVTNLQDGAALSWVSGTNQVFAITYDTTGQPDPILLATNTQLTDGTFAGNTVSDIDIAMTAGLGMTAVWESTDNAGDTAIHLRFASTNALIAGALAPGLVGGELTVVGSQEGGAETAVDAVIQGYEIVNNSNDTLEVGFHVGFAVKNGAFDTSLGDNYGALTLARYEIPVYDVDATGTALVIDAFGNLAPSSPSAFGTGAETAPASIGLDGVRGTADDYVAIVLTDAGLFAANNVPLGANVIQGRNISMGSLHDGQLVVTYIDSTENVKMKIFVPSVNQTADRETGGLGGVDVVATGVTAYFELALPPGLTAGLGSVASASQTQYIVPQQNGSFGVFWAASNGSGVDIKGIIYSGAGTNWSPTPVITFASGLSANADFHIAPTGVTPGGLEDGFFVSWESGSGIAGQRFDMTGAAVGTSIAVGDPSSGTPGAHDIAGIDDGRMLAVYEDGGNVSAQYLDNREPGISLSGPRTGAPRDVIVGTVGDDAIDGRALGDDLYGGLGNDLITMGSGADIGHGGDGNDTIVAGTGQDQLLGEAGDDLLWGGLSGPIDPKVDRDLQAGLAAAGVNAALIASDPGADIISGGAGTDTISFQGEFGDFNINLSTGIVTSDRDLNGTFVLEDVIGQIVDDGAGGTIFTVILDVENATGGLGDDTLVGTSGDNVLDGGAGSNTFDGLGGNDTVIIHGAFDEYQISYDTATNTFTFFEAGPSGHTDIVRNVETFVFEDTTKTVPDLLPGPQAVDDTATVLEDGTVTINILGNDFASGASVTAVNGQAIVSGGPAVAVQHGTVSLVSSGTGSRVLVFTPTHDYFGPATFTYTIANASGQFSTANVNVTVTNTNDAPVDIVFSGNAVNENAAAGTVVATLSTVDPDNTASVTNDNFTYALPAGYSGPFQIIGNQIRVANGAALNFESITKSYAVQVTANDGHGGTYAETVTINVNDVNEAPTDIVFNGNAAITSASITELAASNVVATLSATDLDAGAFGASGIKFALADSADGRFAVAGNQIVVANPALIDFEDPTNPSHAYVLRVLAADAGGLTRVETLTVSIANAAAGTGATQETVVAGATAADNTLNGGASNDLINGLAGRDVMNGGLGNDAYFVDNSGDKVNENASAGTDTVYVSAITSLSLANNVENLIYTGTANGTWRGNALNNAIAGGSGNDQIQGDNGDDHLIGNAGADTVQGGAGNDRLYGGAGNDNLDGGAGNDVMSGGSGNDTLTVRDGNDTIILQAGFGNDAVSGFDSDAAGGQDLISVAGLGLTADAIGISIIITGSATLTTIAIGADVLTLNGVNVNSIDHNDFLFG